MTEEKFAAYEKAIADYETARASQDWRRAVDAALSAIINRPCREALPQLEAFLRESQGHLSRQEFARSRSGRFLAAFGVRLKGVAYGG